MLSKTLHAITRIFAKINFRFLAVRDSRDLPFSLFLSIVVNAKVAIPEWFLLHLSGKFVSSFYDPFNKIILGKCPVAGRGQSLDRQLHPLSLMQK
jgi:hypothetical protein